MANLKNIKTKTYNNFMRVYNALINEKHYTPGDAEKITRHIFDNAESESMWTRGGSPRGVQYFYDRVVDADVYTVEYIAK